MDYMGNNPRMFAAHIMEEQRKQRLREHLISLLFLLLFSIPLICLVLWLIGVAITWKYVVAGLIIEVILYFIAK